jgi:hypothetical protein
MPIVKQTPPRPLPPARARQDQRELRERFPRIKPEQEHRGRQPQASPPATVSPAVPVKPGTGPGRDRDGIRQPAPPQERTTPAVQQPTPREGKSRGEERQNSGESRRPAPGGKPAPQAQPPQRGDEGKAFPPATQPATRGDKPTGTVVAPANSNRGGEERQRTGASPTPGTPGRPTAVMPGSNDRQAVPTSIPAVPPRSEKPQGTPSAPAAGSRAPSVQRGEQPRGETPAKKEEPRKVWRVTTPEATQGNGQTPVPAPGQEREGRGRERR